MRGFYGGEVHAHLRQDPDAALDRYRRRIGRELAAVGLDARAVRGRTVLDVGTGFQSIVFAELGAARVFHLDIDPVQVAWTRREARRRDMPITSTVADLTRDLGPAADLDLVFLCGVYHHLPLPCGLFTRLAARCRPAAAIYLRCYRSGTWSRWLMARLRPLAAGLSPAVIRRAFHAMHPLEDNRQFLSDLIDDLFVPVWGCFDPWRFQDAARRDGMECQDPEPAQGFAHSDENVRLLFRLGQDPRRACRALDAVRPVDQLRLSVAVGRQPTRLDWNRFAARIARLPAWERAVRVISLARLMRTMRVADYFSVKGMQPDADPGAERVAALTSIQEVWRPELPP